MNIKIHMEMKPGEFLRLLLAGIQILVTILMAASKSFFVKILLAGVQLLECPLSG